MRKFPHLPTTGQDREFGWYHCFAMRRARIFSAYSSVSISGLVFSLTLLRLGIALESPELLKYILIATIPLSLIVAFAVLSFYRHICTGVVLLAAVLSAIACVPMESVTYIFSEWGFLGPAIFERVHLPTLIGILFGWSVVVATLAVLASSSYIGVQKLLTRGGRA